MPRSRYSGTVSVSHSASSGENHTLESACPVSNGLPLAAGGPCLHLNLHRSASITEGLSHLLPHGVPSRLGQRGQRLTSGASAALKRAVISVESGQHEHMLLGVGLDVQKAGVEKELLEPRRVAKRKSTVGGLGQVWL